jgi:NADH dehydrogenase FAD-containing subunit
MKENGMGKHLVLVGGGHAHMTAMKRLSEFVELGHRVTLVSPSAFHYYSGMGPGMLGGFYRPEEARFHLKPMVEDRGRMFIEDKVVRVDADRRVLHLASGGEVSYDVASFNVGSQVPAEAVAAAEAETVVPAKPVAGLLTVRRRIQQWGLDDAVRVVVVGGGPAGVEIAGNAWRAAAEREVDASVTLISGSQILAGFPPKAQDIARKSLAGRGVEVLEGHRVVSVSGKTVELDDGEQRDVDVTVLALGVRPSPLFRDSGLPTGQDGGLLVNEYLQCTEHPELFGGGDCITPAASPLDRVGVYAVRQNPVLHHNLLAALEGGELRAFEPGGAYLLIFNLGNGRGLFLRKKWVWDGRLAFWMKNFLDRRFMRRFQVSGEREESQRER